MSPPEPIFRGAERRKGAGGPGSLPDRSAKGFLNRVQRDSIAAVVRAVISALDSLVTRPWLAPTAP